MNDITGSELDEPATALRETFASREALADPDVALAVAATVVSAPRHPRPWRAYLAVAAVVAVASTTAYAVARGGDARSEAGRLSAPTASGTGRDVQTHADNRAAAAAESARVVGLVPLPESAERLATRPEPWPEDYGMSLGPSDGTLTTTAYWSVPLDGDALEDYLVSHDAPSMTRVEDAGDGPVGIRDITYEQESSPDPSAFLPVSLLVQWREVGGRTLVRADTFTAARTVRTPETFIDGTVTAVDIERVEFRPSGGRNENRELPPVHLAGQAESKEIDRIVLAANQLLPSIKPPFAASCPYPGDPPPSITVTFHTSRGVVELHLETACWGQVQVTREGSAVSPTLDPGDFAQTVDRVAGSG